MASYLFTLYRSTERSGYKLFTLIVKLVREIILQRECNARFSIKELFFITCHLATNRMTTSLGVLKKKQETLSACKHEIKLLGKNKPAVQCEVLG